MISDRSGSTDVLSSLPLTACCIFAVMILLAAIGQSAGRSSARGGEDAEEACRELLDEAISLLTEDHIGGKRYLYDDWASRAQRLLPLVGEHEGLSFSICVRLFGEDVQELPLSGNSGGCREVFTESAPLLSMKAGRCLPGEIIAKVGR